MATDLLEICPTRHSFTATLWIRCIWLLRDMGHTGTLHVPRRRGDQILVLLADVNLLLVLYRGATLHG